MIHRFTEFLRGANGGLELNRIVGAFGGFAYIVGAHVFVAWNMRVNGEFDVTAYCLAFPGGLATLGLGTAGAVALKDRNVAAAKATTAGAADAAEDVADAAQAKAQEFRP
jgi:hypothetical protein